MPPQVSTFPLEEWLHVNDQRPGIKSTKGRVPQLESEVCKSESIDQSNVQIIYKKTFGECSGDSTDALTLDSRRHSYPSQSVLVSC